MHAIDQLLALVRAFVTGRITSWLRLWFVFSSRVESHHGYAYCGGPKPVPGCQRQFDRSRTRSRILQCLVAERFWVGGSATNQALTFRHQTGTPLSSHTLKSYDKGGNERPGRADLPC